MSQSKEPTLKQCFAAELLGTFILIFFGCGAVHTAILFSAQAGLWQVAIVWGVAVTLAVYAVGGISGAHINPAITICLAFWAGFDRKRVAPYIAAQLLGAIAAAAVLFVFFGPKLTIYEAEKGIVRGQPGSEITASCYGEFFPNPGGLTSGDTIYDPGAHAELRKTVPHYVAFVAEVIGTGILAFVVLAFTDARNRGAPAANQAAVFIGLTVALLISVIAPLTQACFNPARDFGPRLFTFFAGWGQIALPLGTDWGWLTVYIIAPTLGAVLGGGLYAKVFRTIYAELD
ncbi:MIP/aquaporin family protein [Aureliella helgolandensis]|uniref:Glycerol uptake facilitator protein n=1 Tax=Aureliella helgolandensis TaxID=2527968 RepID=A0A518G8E2_9BACT|nr:MIP/aquaporin family protein [Aureliella helgolandensis]QDV24858.1 Glycerol uptake facilitator protein [Aureliella helgolandensis]